MLGIVDRMMTAIERGLGVVLICAVLLNFTNVIGRYLFGIALLSADELEIFSLVFLTFVGAGVVAWRRQNLRMDVIRSMMPPAVQRALRLVEGVVGVALAGFIIFFSFRYTARVVNLGQVSDMAGIPMWVPHGAVLVGFVLIGFSILLRDLVPSLHGDETALESAEAAALRRAEEGIS